MYGMSEAHYNQLIGWIDKEANHKYRITMPALLFWTIPAFLTLGFAFTFMVDEREKYAEKEMIKLCRAVSAEYEPHGITIRFKGKKFTEGGGYIISAQGHAWREAAGRAG